MYRTATILTLLLTLMMANVKAYAEETEQDYRKYIKKYTEQIKKNNNDYWAYNLRGTYYYKLREFDRAIKDFQTAINIKPNDWFYSDMAEAYLAKGMPRKALEKLARAIQLHDALEYHCTRAFCYDLLGESEKALQDYSGFFARINPHQKLEMYYVGYVRRAYIYYTKKQYQQAFNDMAIAIQLAEKYITHPSDDHYYIRFLVCLKLGKYAQARQDLTRVLRNGFNHRKRVVKDIKEIPRKEREAIMQLVEKHMVQNAPLNDVDFFDKVYLTRQFLGFEQ